MPTIPRYIELAASNHRYQPWNDLPDASSIPIPSMRLDGNNAHWAPDPYKEAIGAEGLPSSTWDVWGASFEQQLTDNPMAALLRMQGRAQATGIAKGRNFTGEEFTPERLLSADEATRKYGVEDRGKKVLTFDEPIAESAAAQLRDLKIAELRRQFIFEGARGGIGETIGSFGAGMIASLVDPLNVVSAFIPVVPEAMTSAALAKAGWAGRTAIRGAVGAAEGAVGAAVVEPLVYWGLTSEQADYGLADSFANVTIGTALGAGLHMGLGGMLDYAEYRRDAADAAAAKELAAEIAKARSEAAKIAPLTEREALGYGAGPDEELGGNIFLRPQPEDEIPGPVPPQALPRYTEAERAALQEDLSLRGDIARTERDLAALPKGVEKSVETLARLAAVERELSVEGIGADEYGSLLKRQRELIGATDATKEGVAAIVALRRLDEIGRALSEDPIASVRKALSRERDKILTDTTPEKLRAEANAYRDAIAARRETLKAEARPFEDRRVLEGRKSRLERELSDIQSERLRARVAEIVESPGFELKNVAAAIRGLDIAPNSFPERVEALPIGQKRELLRVAVADLLNDGTVTHAADVARAFGISDGNPSVANAAEYPSHYGTETDRYVPMPQSEIKAGNVDELKTSVDELDAMIRSFDAINALTDAEKVTLDADDKRIAEANAEAKAIDIALACALRG